MGKTIIQTIGPLYGEVVNGTVFGRPNGSVYVPIANTISITAPSNRYIRKDTSSDGKSYYYVLCNSAGNIQWNNVVKIVAESQDIQNYIEIQVSATDDFETVYIRSISAGQFNIQQTYVAGPSATEFPDIVADDTYYIRAVLMSAGGVPVATSATIEVTGVVPE